MQCMYACMHACMYVYIYICCIYAYIYAQILKMHIVLGPGMRRIIILFPDPQPSQRLGEPCAEVQCHDRRAATATRFRFLFRFFFQLTDAIQFKIPKWTTFVRYYRMGLPGDVCWFIKPMNTSSLSSSL